MLEATYTWNGGWTSDDLIVADILNMIFPDEEDLPRQPGFREITIGSQVVHGYDAIALESILFLGKRKIKVIEYNPDPWPVEEEGVLY